MGELLSVWVDVRQLKSTLMNFEFLIKHLYERKSSDELKVGPAVMRSQFLDLEYLRFIDHYCNRG